MCAPMGARRSGDQWLAIVTEFEQSSQSVERYCAKLDIRPSTFRWWRWRLQSASDRTRTLAALREKDEVRLVPVSVVGATEQVGGAAAIEITFADVSVRVVSGTDAAYVATLVAELRSRC